MRLAWPPLLLLVALTAACAGKTPVATTLVADTAPAAPAAPAPVAGYDWHLTTDDGSARLAYGVETSDDLKLGLDCAAGSGQVDVLAMAPAGVRIIHLESGGETQRLAADGEQSGVGDGDLLTARADASEPVFQRFRRLGWMAQWIGDRREVYAPHPGSKAGVERFFALCD